MFSKAYIRVHPATLLIRTNSERFYSEILKEYKAHLGDRTIPDGRMTLTEDERVGFDIPEGAIRVSVQSPSSFIYRHRETLIFVEQGRCIIRIDQAAREVVASAVRGENVFDRLRFISKRLMIKILEEKGLAWIHGAAVSDGQSAILFTGITGSGKTTSLLTMLESGYRLMTDDVVLIDGSLVLPFFLRSMIHRSTLERFSSLKLHLVGDLDWSEQADGFYMNLHDVYGSQSEPVKPKAIFNTYIWNSHNSKYIESSSSKTLPKMIRNYVTGSGGIFEPSSEEIKRFFSIYSQILDKVPCFDLYIGRDSKSLHNTIEEALSRCP